MKVSEGFSVAKFRRTAKLSSVFLFLDRLTFAFAVNLYFFSLLPGFRHFINYISRWLTALVFRENRKLFDVLCIVHLRDCF